LTWTWRIMSKSEDRVPDQLTWAMVRNRASTVDGMDLYASVG
jgi:hypothetical protein